MIGGALLISVRKEVPKLGGNRLRHPHLDNAKTNWKQKAVQPRLRALGSSQYGLMSRQRKTRRNPLSQKKRIPRPPTREMLIRSLILEEWAGQCMALTLFWPAARKKKKGSGSMQPCGRWHARNAITTPTPHATAATPPRLAAACYPENTWYAPT